MSPARRARRGERHAPREPWPVADYDRIAPWFAPLERVCFGSALQRARTRFHPRLASARSILCLGPGDGRALGPLLLAAPAARIEAVEPSARMRSLALTRLDAAQAERVSWRAADWWSSEPRLGRFDAIVSDFFLDQFQASELEALVASVARHLEPQGLWSVADFRPPPEGRGAWPQRATLAGLYLAFGATTGLATRRLVPIEPAFERAGLERLATWSTRRGWIGADLWRRRCPGPR